MANKPKPSTGKLPWVKWYLGDWKSEPRLEMTSLVTRGVWREILDHMYRCDQDGIKCNGRLTVTIRQICQIARCTPDEAGTFIDEAFIYGFCDIEVTPDPHVTRDAKVTRSDGQRDAPVTITCRRIAKAAKEREISKRSSKKYRDKSKAQGQAKPVRDGSVTPERSEVRVQSTDKPPPKPSPKPKPRARSFTPPSGSELKSELPWLDAGAWDAWVVYRRQLGKPLKTMIGVDKQLRFLAQHQQAHVQIIEQSMRNEYQGLFELKTNGSAGKGRAQTRGERNAQAARNVVRMLDQAGHDGGGPGDDSDGRLIEARPR